MGEGVAAGTAPTAAVAQTAAPGWRGRASWGLVVGVLSLGMLLRLMDLTDEPLDFHPMPQLHRALIARAMYLRSSAPAGPGAGAVQASVGAYEPPMLERLVAWSYQAAGGEYPWIARVWNAAFWLAAGWTLFAMARRSTSMLGGIVTLAYFLVLPFGVQVSRAFMPDSLMVLLIVVSGYALLRWGDTRSWAWAAVAGLATGGAILAKGRIAPLLLMTLLVFLLGDARRLRVLRDPQVWLVGTLSVVVPGIYYVVLIPGATSGWVSEGTLNVLPLLADPSFYSRWLFFLDNIVYAGVMLLALFGTMLLPPSVRRLGLGWWIGFVAYGLLLPYNMVTHNYYNLPIVPAIALGLAPVGDLLLDRVRTQTGWFRAAMVGACLLALFYPAWRIRSVIVGQDFRAEPLGWQKIGRELPDDGPIIAITQDYGYRLSYYGGRRVDLWPSVQDQAYAVLRGHNTSDDIGEVFDDLAGGYRYFLITNFSELDAQVALKEYLYATYPVVIEGEGYLLFDLASPRGTGSGGG